MPPCGRRAEANNRARGAPTGSRAGLRSGAFPAIILGMGAPRQHAVAVIGGATAGAEVAGRLAAQGAVVAVFE